MQWSSFTVLAFLSIFNAIAADFDVGSLASSRLQGAKPVRIEEAPYQVSLQSLGVHICGGSIISERHVLTAGRCVYDETPSTLTIRSGTSTRQIGGSVHYITRIHDYHFKIHPNGSIENDIVVVEVTPDFDLSATRWPINIERNRTLEYGSIANVTGWGEVEGGHEPVLLRSLAVPIISNETCTRFVNTVDNYGGGKFCAGFLTVGGKGTCHLDEGGPLISVRFNLQIGIVTRNIYPSPCAEEGRPDIYTHVALYSEWIFSIISPEKTTTILPPPTTPPATPTTASTTTSPATTTTPTPSPSTPSTTPV